MILWWIFITIHTVVATLCFISGCFLMSPRNTVKYKFLMPLFTGSLLLMLVFMIASTLSHWTIISRAESITFSALAGLGCYIVYRGFEAKRLFGRNEIGARYFDAVGFVLIALFDGFAIVGLLDMGAPAWLITTGGILAIFIGRYFVNRTKKQYLTKSNIS